MPIKCCHKRSSVPYFVVEWRPSTFTSLYVHIVVAIGTQQFSKPCSPYMLKVLPAIPDCIHLISKPIRPSNGIGDPRDRIRVHVFRWKRLSAPGAVFFCFCFPNSLDHTCSHISHTCSRWQRSAIFCRHPTYAIDFQWYVKSVSDAHRFDKYTFYWIDFCSDGAYYRSKGHFVFVAFTIDSGNW